MEQRIYHGLITPNDVARCLYAQFHRGNFRVQQIGSGEKIIVQISTGSRPSSGGQTTISVSIHTIEDGVLIEMGEQQWLGLAASLGFTAIAALRNPFSLLGRLNDLAQDVESLQLSTEIWKVIGQSAEMLESSFEISDRLRRIECKYCLTANSVGESHCIACGAPLGSSQPKTCHQCGYVIISSVNNCSNCGGKI
jgi:hypothetical protein